MKNTSWISKVIWFLLFLNPILDIITSFSLHIYGQSMPIILGIKFGFLILLGYLNFKLGNKSASLYVLLLSIYFCSFFGVMYYEKGLDVFLFEAQNLFRTFYFPLFFLFLSFLVQKKLFLIEEKYLFYFLIFSLFFLVVPEIFQLGFDSYAHSKIGGVGWFYSTNEISGILAILGPIFLAYLKNLKGWQKILSFFFYSMGILVLGTKVPVLTFFITLSIYFFFFLYHLWKEKKWKKLGAMISFCIVGLYSLFLFMPFTSFYQNIKIHLNFLEIHQFQDLLTYEHIDHFIFSERLSFLENTHEIYQNSSLPMKLFGLGVAKKDAFSIESYKMVEMDYFDLFYHYGVFGFFFFFLPFWKHFSWRGKIEKKISIFLVFLLLLYFL